MREAGVMDAGITAEAAETPRSGAFATSDAYRRYVLGLLFVVYVVNFIDRSILNILLEEIKREFEPSDTALGFLSGVAFAIFYATLGIPIARWADRGVRRDIIALALFVWSGMTALCGIVRTFPQLVLARIGVGVGEAGCSPPAHSILSDYYPPERRGTAFAIYALGIPVGTAFGFFTGGWMAETLGWRAAFLFVGLPGLALALIVRLTLREPPRGHSEARSDLGPPPDPMTVMRAMWSKATFRHLAIAAALHAFVGYGVAAWNAAFLIRTHGMSVGAVGSWLAGISIVGGGLGTFLGGWLSDRLTPRDARFSLWVPGISTLAAVPLSMTFYLLPDVRVALAIASFPVFLGAMYLGPTFAITQALAPLRMRAVASAFLLFLLNLIGLGLGPQMVGVASDLLAPRLDQQSLRGALVLTVMINLWSGLHYFLGARTLRADLATAAGR
jgi:MFS family permease